MYLTFNNEDRNKKESDTYFEFQKEFSREENVFLLVHRLPIELNDNFIDSLYQITNTLRSSSYFIKIVSLTDIHSQSESLEGDNISARMLNMVSKDSTFGSIWITLKDEYNSFKKRSEAIDYLNQNNIKSIIIDHHEIYRPYPKCDCLINPKKVTNYDNYDYFMIRDLFIYCRNKNNFTFCHCFDILDIVFFQIYFNIFDAFF